MKKKTCIRIESLTMSAMMLFTACSNTNVMDKNEVSFSYSDSDLNNFVTFDKMNDFNWYVIETLDGEKTEIKITKRTILSKKSSDVTEYYYTDVLKEDYKVYAVLYNKEDKTYWVETGPDIISAVPLTSYLEKYDLIKASYSKEEIKDIYIKIKNDYEKEKELDNSGKVYIKNNSIY